MACCVVEVEGEHVRVYGGAPMTPEDAAFLAEIIRAAKHRNVQPQGEN